MKALVKTSPLPGVEMKEIAQPKPRAGEVLIKVRAAALCGTDLHIVDWSPWAHNAGIQLPCTIGHECCGEVVEVGADVTGVNLGDHVVAETHIPCGTCLQCQIGEQHICNNLRIFGVHTNGCFAEYALIPAVCARKIPKEIPFAVGSILEPLGTAFRTAQECAVGGTSVAVVGCGPIGLFAVAAASFMGASQIFALDVSSSRLDMAKKMGASTVIHSGQEDAVAIIKEQTGGFGVNSIIECSGNVAAIKQGFQFLRKGGHYGLIGLPSKKLELELGSEVVFKEAHVFGVHGRKMFSTWNAMENALASGRLNVLPVITHQLPLEQYEEGIKLAKSGEAGKVVFVFA